jgi:hypothetical protein
LNRFAYALADPIGLVDPLGLFSCTVKIQVLPGKDSSIKNNAAMAQALANEMERIFNGAGVGVQFVDSHADYTLVPGKEVPADMHLDEGVAGYNSNDPNKLYPRGWVWKIRLAKQTEKH